MTTIKSHLFKASLLFVAFLITSLFYSKYAINKVMAFSGNVDLTEFVTPLTSVSTTGFYISSGEFIKYASAPGDTAGTIRMFKNSNWEQFVVDGGFIRRREDTSWAPAPAGEAGAPDVYCENGNRAVYTLVNDGQPIDGNAKWLPTSITFVSDKANYTASSITISPIDVTALNSRVGCKLKGSLSSIYPASGQLQRMVLTYHPANTFTFCSGLKNDTDLIDILVTDGFGSGDHFYFMKGWGFVGFQDPTGRNAGLGSDGTCNSSGGGGFGPGGEPGAVTEPDCSAGPFNLTIQGTVKSSKVFYQTQDAMTGETVFIDADSEDIAGLPYVKNVPVNGAVVQLHDSVKIPGHDFNTGTVDGMLKQSYKSIATKPDGTFKIEAVSHCGSEGNVYRNDWRGVGYEQYLTISCADKVLGESSPRMVIKDVYGFLLDKKGTGDEVTLNLEDFNVDCQAVPWKTYPGVSKPTGDVKIAKRSKEVFTACSGTSRVASDGNPGVTYPKRKSNTDLIFDDTFPAGSFLGILSGILDWLGGLFDGQCGNDPANTGCWGDWVRDHTPFQGRTEGRDDINTQLFDTAEHAALINLMLGIKEKTATLPLYFLKGAPATYNGREIETYNGYEEKAQLVDCESYRRCNQTLSDPDYPLDNMQTCGGMAFMLGTPFGNIIRANDGINIDPYLSGDAARYAELPKTREVCVDKSSGTDVIVTVSDIMPPEGYCGDVITVNNQIDVPKERPCPDHFACGDYNGDGDATDDGERLCSSLKLQNANNAGVYDVPNNLYKYDIRYFPYSLVYNTETENYGQTEKHTNRTADSYDNVCPHGDNAHGGDGQGYNANEDASGKSKPANSVCEGVNGSYTFYQQVETKFACTDSLCYKKNEATETSPDGKIPPVALAWTPQFPNTSDSRTFVAQALTGADQTITATRKGNIYRVGVPDDLCTCSLVENGTNAYLAKPLDNCLTDAALGQVPKANEPANISDPTKDQVVGKDAHIAKLMARVPGTYTSPVMGGYDYELTKKPLATEGSEQEKHYDQSTTSFSVSKAVSDMIDFVKCALNDGGTAANNQVRRSVDCGRTLRKTAQSTLMVRGTMPPLASLGLSLLGILNAPFTDQVQIKSAGVVDATKTKLELKEDGNKYGFDLSKWSSSEVPGSQGSGDNIDRGVAKMKDMFDFQNSVSNPVWTGQETPACRMVPGWQVKEYPGKGLSALDCTKDGNKCWVGGAYTGNDESLGTYYVLASGDQGATWSEEHINNPGSHSVINLSLYSVPEASFTVSRYGDLFSFINGGLGQKARLVDMHPAIPGYAYTGFVYNVAGGPAGYLATGTARVFYSNDGSPNNWKFLAETDKPGATPAGSKTGCEAMYYPYNCIYPSPDPCDDISTTPAPSCTDPCDNDSSTPLPSCNCGNAGQKPCCCCNFDGNPGTPECPIGAYMYQKNNPNSCWIWNESDISGVDCNEVGDCILAGQPGPRIWSIKHQDLGTADVETIMQSFRTSKRNLGFMNQKAMGVSYPSEDAAYVVMGSNTDGGRVLRSVSTSIDSVGMNWDSVATTTDSLRGIDCFSSTDCIAVGNHGTIIRTTDGVTWSTVPEWEADPKIVDAKQKDVTMFKVAYINKNKVIIVGSRPDTPTTGLIFTLGGREDCGEGVAGNCLPVAGVQIGKRDQCAPAMSVVWNNGNSIKFSGNATSPDFGQSDTVSITGYIKVRDPNTFNSANQLAISGCNNSRSCGQISGFFTVPTLSVKYLGEETKFKIDTSLYSGCSGVTDLILSLNVPRDSFIRLDTKGPSTEGPVSACLDNMSFKGTVVHDMCLKGFAWSQVPNWGSDHFSCGIEGICHGSPEDSGTERAQELGLDTSFNFSSAPCLP